MGNVDVPVTDGEPLGSDQLHVSDSVAVTVGSVIVCVTVPDAVGSVEVAEGRVKVTVSVPVVAGSEVVMLTVSEAVRNVMVSVTVTGWVGERVADGNDSETVAVGIVRETVELSDKDGKVRVCDMACVMVADPVLVGNEEEYVIVSEAVNVGRDSVREPDGVLVTESVARVTVAVPVLVPVGTVYVPVTDTYAVGNDIDPDSVSEDVGSVTLEVGSVAVCVGSVKVPVPE